MSKCIDITKQRFKYKLTVPEVDLNSEEFCYWLGFILADGCISKQDVGSDRFIIALNKKDRSHLVKLRKWLRSSHPIVYKPKRSCVELNIRSQNLCDMLRRFGITERKSLTAIPDYRLVDNRHFWRGMIDGDGTMFVDGRDKLFHLGLLGTYDVCKRFWNFCHSLNKSFQDVAICKSPWKGYSVRTSGRKAKFVARIIYKGATVVLARKKKIVEVHCG